MRILSFDLSRLHGISVWCRYNDDVVRQGGGGISFGQVVTKVEALQAAITSYRPDVVVIESCGISAHLHDALQGFAGSRLVVANINAESFRWRNLNRKTDKDDALRLAKLMASGDISPVHIPPSAIRQHKH